MLITDRGQTIRTRVEEIRLTGRNAQGVRVMHVDKDERVVAMESVGERESEDELDAAGAPASDSDPLQQDAQESEPAQSEPAGEAEPTPESEPDDSSEDT